MELKNMLIELSDAVSLGGMGDALKVAKRYLSDFAEISKHDNSLVGVINPTASKTVLIDAHIDEVGMIVTSVKDGFLKVASVGSIDTRLLPCQRVTVFGKQTIRGVFCSTPPHLKDSDNSAPKQDELYIDTGLKEQTEEIIPIGSRVAFCTKAQALMGDCVTGKSMDNRAGVAAAIRCAELISKENLDLKVVILLSDMEEVGLRGAKTAAYDINPDLAIVVDVSFGNQPDVSPDKTGTLGGGPMIGISPILSQEVSDGLLKTAEDCAILFQTEVMGSNTSTNADVISINCSGVKTGLVSIPLRNMHTPLEVVNLSDVEATAQLLAEFIKRV